MEQVHERLMQKRKERGIAERMNRKREAQQKYRGINERYMVADFAQLQFAAERAYLIEKTGQYDSIILKRV